MAKVIKLHTREKVHIKMWGRQFERRIVRPLLKRLLSIGKRFFGSHSSMFGTHRINQRLDFIIDRISDLDLVMTTVGFERKARTNFEARVAASIGEMQAKLDSLGRLSMQDLSAIANPQDPVIQRIVEECASDVLSKFEQSFSREKLRLLNELDTARLEILKEVRELIYTSLNRKV